MQNQELANKTLRMRSAMEADQEELFQFMQTQDGDMLLAALRNPRLDENHLLTLLKRRNLPDDLFETLYASKRLLESYNVTRALACHPDTPAHISQTLLPRFYIFDLVKVCETPAIGPDLRILAERCIIQRLAAQPLGNKLTLARRGSAVVVEALLMEGTPMLVDACLANPRLKEGAVHRFIAAHASTAETISMVARNTRWKTRPEIRLAILKNPRTPAIWFTAFLPALSPRIMKELMTSPRLTPEQKGLVRKVLRRRGGVL